MHHGRYAGGKERSMADLPADVDERYRQLARQRNWPRDVETAFRASVAWIRGLDEGPGPRSYYERVDDVGLVDQGPRWLWETVSIDDAVVAVKQKEEPVHGPARRHSRRCVQAQIA